MIGTGHISLDGYWQERKTFNPVCSILMEISYAAVSSSKSSFCCVDSHPNMLNGLFCCLYAPLATEIANNQQMAGGRIIPVNKMSMGFGDWQVVVRTTAARQTGCGLRSK